MSGIGKQILAKFSDGQRLVAERVRQQSARAAGLGVFAFAYRLAQLVHTDLGPHPLIRVPVKALPRSILARTLMKLMAALPLGYVRDLVELISTENIATSIIRPRLGANSSETEQSQEKDKP